MQLNLTGIVFVSRSRQREVYYFKKVKITKRPVRSCQIKVRHRIFFHIRLSSAIALDKS